MKLELILAADYANITNNGKLNVMGIFKEINAYQFPARHPMMQLVIKLRSELGESGQQRDIFVKLLDPDGRQLMSLEGKIDIPTIANSEVNAILELRDIIFPSPGRYQFVVLVDKDFKGDLAIEVKPTIPQDHSSGQIE